uniref:Uncharacterized protein n=1 Tax=Anguilla anguilla TaxID=7936 RepID=A0A0E9T2M1_ANGAN
MDPNGMEGSVMLPVSQRYKTLFSLLANGPTQQDSDTQLGCQLEYQT